MDPFANVPNLLTLLRQDAGIQKLVSNMQQAAGGATRGMTTDLAGAPIDLLSGGLSAIGVPIGPRPVGGSAWLRSVTGQPAQETGAGLIGNLLSALVNPESLAGKGALLAGAVKALSPQDLQTLQKFYEPKLLEQLAGGPDWKSRSRMVAMSPSDFLAMASRTDDFPYSGKLRRINETIDSGELLREPGFLMLNRYGQVVGHEGRHRALAMQQRGIPLVPIELRSDNIRWSEQTPGMFDYAESWPATMRQQDAKFSIPFPIPQEDAATAALRVILEGVPK